MALHVLLASPIYSSEREGGRESVCVCVCVCVRVCGERERETFMHASLLTPMGSLLNGMSYLVYHILTLNSVLYHTGRIASKTPFEADSWYEVSS